MLSLEKMGAVNLDKSCRKMEMNSSSGERNNGENGDELELLLSGVEDIVVRTL